MWQIVGKSRNRECCQTSFEKGANEMQWPVTDTIQFHILHDDAVPGMRQGGRKVKGYVRGRGKKGGRRRPRGKEKEKGQGEREKGERGKGEKG